MMREIRMNMIKTFLSIYLSQSLCYWFVQFCTVNMPDSLLRNHKTRARLMTVRDLLFLKVDLINESPDRPLTSLACEVFFPRQVLCLPHRTRQSLHARSVRCMMMPGGRVKFQTFREAAPSGTKHRNISKVS